jgi:hypothetical protein
VRAPEREAEGAKLLGVHAYWIVAADYDDYFGVVRSEDMKVGDYWTQAVEKLAAVHRGFALDAEARTALMRGDAVLLAIISEALVADGA